MLNKYKSAAGGKLLLESYDALIKAWGVNVAEEDVQTIYGSTHLIIAGDSANPPLVLFHGVGDDSALMWLVNARALAAHFRIIAVDTIGGPGKSQPNEEYFKSFDQTKWIDCILDTKALGRVYIAGVSNGAYLTQLYTAKRPERVIKSVCMSGSIAVRDTKNPIWRMIRVFLPEALFPSAKNALNLMKKLCGDPVVIDVLIAAQPELMKHYLYLLKYFNNQSMFVHKITGLDDEEIAIIREKTKLLIGACDILTYHSDALESLKKYNLNYRIVQNAGHALNMEQPELVNDEIVSFLLG